MNPVRLQTAAPFAIAVVLVLLLHQSSIPGTIDRAWFDTLQRTLASRAPVPEDTAIVLVDEQSLRALGSDPYNMRWPWPRRAFAGLFAALHRAGAKHIVADFIFLENSADAVDDALVGSTAAGLRNVTLGALRNRDHEAPPALPAVWPEDFRQRNASLFPHDHPRWGWVDITPDSDGAIRRYAPGGALAAGAPWSAEAEAAPAARDTAFGDANLHLRWRGGLEQLKARGVPVIPAAPFATLGLQLLDDATAQCPDFENPAALAAAIDAQPPLPADITARVLGRVVFVGANAAGTFDSIATPVGAPEPGLLAHWTAFADLRAGTFARAAGRAAAPLAALAAMLLVTLAARKSLARSPNPKPATPNPQSPGSPWRLATVAGALALAALLGSAALLQFLNLWFAPMLVVAGAVCAFGAELVAGYLRERALKREIQSWFGAYVSPAVVENLLRNPGSLALGGERRELTVFFSDIAGFTTLSERLPSEQLVALVNTYLQELSECVLANGGYIDKYIGDAIMAVFGAPEPLENHALSACRAALDSLRALETLNARIERDHGHRLAIRIGINTGEMIVGNVGSEKKKNYTVLGDAVNLAARLEGANKEFGTGVLLGPLTAQRAGHLVATRPLALLRVKGKANAVPVRELLGQAAHITDSQRAYLRACEDGFEAWCTRRFSAAAEAYAHAVMLRPDDTASIRYHEAALELVRHQPGDDWDPTLELHTK